MNILTTNLDGVLIVEPEIHEDNRGFLLETFVLDKYEEKFGKDVKFVQDNLARTFKNNLRGMHFQKNFPQGKLIYSGEKDKTLTKENIINCYDLDIYESAEIKLF